MVAEVIFVPYKFFIQDVVVIFDSTQKLIPENDNQKMTFNFLTNVVQTNLVSSNLIALIFKQC